MNDFYFLKSELHHIHCVFTVRLTKFAILMTATSPHFIFEYATTHAFFCKLCDNTIM